MVDLSERVEVNSELITLKRKMLAGLVFCQLALITFFTLHHRPLVEFDFSDDLALYGMLSGAYTSYSFFAPSVSSETRIRYQLFNDSGKKLSESTLKTDNNEVNLRLNTMANFIPISDSEDLICRSIASFILSENREATSVNIYIEINNLPELRGGKKREKWSTYFEGRYSID